LQHSISRVISNFGWYCTPAQDITPRRCESLDSPSCGERARESERANERERERERERDLYAMSCIAGIALT